MTPTPEEIAMNEVSKAIRDKLGRRIQYFEEDIDKIKYTLLPKDQDGQVCYVEVKVSTDKYMGKPPRASKERVKAKKVVESMSAEEYLKKFRK